MDDEIDSSDADERHRPTRRVRRRWDDAAAHGATNANAVPLGTRRASPTTMPDDGAAVSKQAELCIVGLAVTLTQHRSQCVGAPSGPDDCACFHTQASSPWRKGCIDRFDVRCQLDVRVPSHAERRAASHGGARELEYDMEPASDGENVTAIPMHESTAVNASEPAAASSPQSPAAPDERSSSVWPRYRVMPMPEHLPRPTAKEHALMARTALSVARTPQLLLVLRVRHGTEPAFAFLHTSHAAHAYFTHLVDRARRPDADWPDALPDTPDQSDTPVAPFSVAAEAVEPSSPGGLVDYRSDGVTDSDSDNAGTVNQVPPLASTSAPPPGMQEVMDKLLVYVRRNGAAFLSMLRQRNSSDAKLSFLQEWSPWYTHFQARVEAELRQRAGNEHAPNVHTTTLAATTSTLAAGSCAPASSATDTLSHPEGSVSSKRERTRRPKRQFIDSWDVNPNEGMRVAGDAAPLSAIDSDDAIDTAEGYCGSDVDA